MPRSLVPSTVLALVILSGSSLAAQTSLSLPAIELSSGVPVSGVAGRSVLSYFGVSVSAPSRLMFDLTGGTDPQIFLAKDRLPTFADYDVRIGFGQPALNFQVATEPGEWYIGVRDVNLDFPFPAETFTLVATLEEATQSPPLGFDLSSGARRETSSPAGQLQYFTLAVPEQTSVVDYVLGERFGSGNADLFVASNSYPSLAPDGTVVGFTSATSSPGNDDRLRVVAPPAGQLVAALHGAAPPGYENVFLRAVTTPFTFTVLENNRDQKVTGAAPMHFRITVPPGQIRLSLQTSGGTGASHLSMKLGGPILSSAVFPLVTADLVASDDPRKPNDATLVIQNPAPGDYYLLLEPEGAAGFADVQVKARFRSSL
ncbi:MAG: PPC domain-containing protein [Thermoanaerobaculia bacterium]